MTGPTAPAAVSDLAHFRNLGMDHGLAVGLAAVLDGLEPATVAPQQLAVLPATGLPEGARILPNALVAREGLAVVRFPAQPGETGHGLTGGRAAALAAVRLGVLSHMLDLAVQRLSTRRFAGVPLIDQQLVAGAVADVITDLELLAATCVKDAGDLAAALHERLTDMSWMVTRFFGAEGYVADHPVRCLHVSVLVADIWIPRTAIPEGGE